MTIGRKRERPDYKSYCSIGLGGVWWGDIQEQRGPFEACG